MSTNPNSIEIIKRIKASYKDAKTELISNSNFELLIAVILSAQCTDAKVNKVTKILFKIANNPKDLAKMDLVTLQEILRPLGLYHRKAKYLIDVSKQILKEHQGKVPCDLNALCKLKGVGRKTANVVLNIAFSKNTIAVDTHVARVCQRTKIALCSTPYEIEKTLNNLPEVLKENLHNQIIHHGRHICKARKPLCEKCFLMDLCPFYLRKKKSLTN